MSATASPGAARSRSSCQWRMSLHAERGRVDQQRLVGDSASLALLPRAITRSPGRSRASASRMLWVRLAMVTGTPVSSRAAATARAAPPAPSTKCRPGGGIDAMGAQIGQEAPAVGVAAGDSAVAEHQRVHRAGVSRAGIPRLSHSAKAARLCGWVTLAPAKPAAARPRTAVANCLRPDRPAARTRRRWRGVPARSRAAAASGNARRASR